MMMLAELALILIYTCALLIKSCDMSSVGTAHRDEAKQVAAAICTTYGFGDDATGASHKQDHRKRPNAHRNEKQALPLGSEFR
jgi:hypothetical protein